MNPPLRLSLRVAPYRITIHATGELTALTAHLLPKVVIGTLRRHAVPALVIDLTGVTAIDDVGEIALQHCEHEAGRRGVLLTVELAPPSKAQPPARRNDWVGRPAPNTGTICRSRITSR